MESSRTQVRKAVLSDLDWIISELKKFSDFYETKHPLFGDEEYARSQLSMLIENHFVRLSEIVEKPTGFIIGIFTPHFFNPKIKTLTAMFWWVAEEYRGGRAAFLLLKDFIDFGEANADWITIAIERKSPLDANALLKRGFILQEQSYLREVS